MTYTLWIFPLLSGYYFLNNFSYTRHKYERLDKDRLVFHSVIFGVFIFILLYIFRIILNHNFPSLIPFLYKSFYNLPIIKIDYFLTCLSSFLISVFITHIINIFLSINKYFCLRKPVERAVENHGDDLEILLKDCLIKGLLLQITLKNNKSYIGYVESIKPPNEEKFIKIVPLISGYRKSENKKLKLTTDYFDAFDLYKNSPEKYNNFSMEIIINKAEVLSANVFDLEIYEAFN
jgi:hypothetical protein